MGFELDIPTPRWALPLHTDLTVTGDVVRYKGAWGGRASGKSHEMAGMCVEHMVMDHDCSVVCIREVQKSLALSAKKLIESKIREFGVSHLFEVLQTEIRRIGGTGICIFVGMQDHTADSVKSLEDFRIAWVEEAQNLSKRSLDLLIPTIRSEGSMLLFSWNPCRKADPIERLLRGAKKRTDAIVVRATYLDNPWLPGPMVREAAESMENDPDGYTHTWLGGYESVGSKVVIPLMWVKSAIGLADDLGIEVTGKVYSSLDVAGAEEGGDENAQAIRQGISLLDAESWNGLDTAITTNRAANNAKIAGADEVYYDSVGVGEGVTGEWASMGRRGEQPVGMTFHPWSGSASVLDPNKRTDPDNPKSPMNKDQYHNLKAQAWFSLRRRFENAHKARKGEPHDPEMLISLPRNLKNIDQIEEELTQPHHGTSGTGKTMVDKQPNGSRSPNLADAINMAFYPCAGINNSWAGTI